MFVAVAILNCSVFFSIAKPASESTVQSKALELTNIFSSLYQSISSYCDDYYKAEYDTSRITYEEYIEKKGNCSKNVSLKLLAPTANKLKENKESLFKNYTYKAAIVGSKEKEFEPDKSEQEIIDNFKHLNNGESTPLTAVEKGIKSYYIAKPIKSAQTTKIIGAHFVYVTSNEVNDSVFAVKIVIALITIGASGGYILLVNLWLKQYVVRPLNRMAGVAEAVSQGDMGAEFERISNDEVGRLAEAFRRMKESLAIAMKKLDNYRIERRSNNNPQE